MAKPVIRCVDDEGVVLESLEIQLRQAFADQYLYEMAQSAAEALELIEELETEQRQIIVLVSDWLMPGMKGDEFLIQVHQRFPDTVKILLTGQATAVAVERTRTEALLHRCLGKPWQAEELIEAIQSGLAT